MIFEHVGVTEMSLKIRRYPKEKKMYRVFGRSYFCIINWKIL